jgi:hypothetical protein
MTTTIRRGALAAMVGGTLWALMPAAMSIRPSGGALVAAAGDLAMFLFAVVTPALLLVALRGARAALDPGPMRTAAVALCAPGLTAILLGLGTEAVTMAVAGAENDIGHIVFLVGELVLIVGEFLLGIAILRRRRDGLARAAATCFLLALPIGVGLAFLLNAVAPETDAGFWAAFTVATGIGWLLMGRAMLPRTAGRPAVA